MTQAALIRGRDRFKSEAAEARRLGCKLEVRTEHGTLDTGTAFARITPVTPKARHHIAKAAADDGQPGRDAIETRQFYSHPGDTLDAIASAVELALNIARTSLD